MNGIKEFRAVMDFAGKSHEKTKSLCHQCMWLSH